MQSPSDPTYESFRDELELVISRHLELFRETPGYCAAMLIQEADYQRAVHGADLDLRETGDGLWVFEIGKANALLGSGNTAPDLDALESDLLMVDDRGAWSP